MSINRLKKKTLRTYERHTRSEKETVARLCACAFPASRTGYSSPRIWGVRWFARPVVPLAGKFPPLGASFEPPWHTEPERVRRGKCDGQDYVKNSKEMKVDLSWSCGGIEGDCYKHFSRKTACNPAPPPGVQRGTFRFRLLLKSLLSALVCPACDQMGLASVVCWGAQTANSSQR